MTAAPFLAWSLLIVHSPFDSSLNVKAAIVTGVPFTVTGNRPRSGYPQRAMAAVQNPDWDRNSESCATKSDVRRPDGAAIRDVRQYTVAQNGLGKKINPYRQ